MLHCGEVADCAVPLGFEDQLVSLFFAEDQLPIIVDAFLELLFVALDSPSI